MSLEVNSWTLFSCFSVTNNAYYVKARSNSGTMLLYYDDEDVLWYRFVPSMIGWSKQPRNQAEGWKPYLLDLKSLVKRGMEEVELTYEDLNV